MPLYIESIDAIARQKQRDVLLLTFTSEANDDNENDDDDAMSQGFSPTYNYRGDPIRQSICQWLTEHNILWYPCDIADSSWICGGYFGEIYLDVPYDESDPQYGLVRDYLEYPDGRMRFETVTFWVYPLERAKKKEPGYWDNPFALCPESLANQTHITGLDLSFCYFKKLPEAMGKLTQLTTLNCYKNYLTGLPEFIGNLNNLTTLVLRENQLNALPESIGNLGNLTSLDISDNKLTALPELIGDLSHLTNLSLSANQLTHHYYKKFKGACQTIDTPNP